MTDHVLRGMAAGGQVLFFGAVTTETVEEARQRHTLTNVATAAVGRTLSAAAMLGAQLKKPEETVTVQIKGNGPLGGVTASCDGRGNLRGFADNPRTDLPLNEKGKLDVGGALGIGVMSIIKDLGLKEPYIGSTHLITSEIGEDLAYYFTASEQVPSAVSLGVLVHPEGEVWVSGGYIVQLLPGAGEAVAEQIEKRIAAFPPLTTFLAEGNTIEEVMEILLEGMDMEVLERAPVRFCCNCSRERVERALISLGKEELKSLIGEGEPVEMSCHYCNEKYLFSIPDLTQIAEDL